jgi:O-methyltransferase
MKPYWTRPARILFRRLCRIPKLQKRFLHVIEQLKFQNWCDTHPSDESPGRLELFRSIVDREELQGPIDLLEFGVFEGASIRWWAENNRHPESTFVGFDCFEGLPESWQDHPKGDFSVAGNLPDIQDPRCSFVKGLFQDTLSDWICGRRFTRRAVLHLDADLYSSTLFVLIHLLPKLNKGDILIFDEFSDYMHEFKAFCDATTAYPIGIECIGHDKGWIRSALKVT